MDVDVPTIKLINIVETALDVCHYTIGEDLLIIGGYDQSISHSHISEVVPQLRARSANMSVS